MDYLPSLSTDALIVAVIGLLIAYGLVFGQMGLNRLAVSIYVGLVLSATFARQLHEMVATSQYGGISLSLTVVQLVLLILPVALLQLGHHRLHMRHKSSMAVTLVLAVLVALLITGSVFMQMEEDVLRQITDNSNLASWIYDLRLWWVGLVPVAMAAEVFLRPRPHH
ncbi:MAG TPA: hypothetical protein VNA68_03385 [Candidatus Dormibacteraeota bacterium]|nr:hypothetical protein [Candidatus Dormibacteraeota bacterium]